MAINITRLLVDEMPLRLFVVAASHVYDVPLLLIVLGWNSNGNVVADQHNSWALGWRCCCVTLRETKVFLKGRKSSGLVEWREKESQPWPLLDSWPKDIRLAKWTDMILLLTWRSWHTNREKILHVNYKQQHKKPKTKNNNNNKKKHTSVNKKPNWVSFKWQ